MMNKTTKVMAKAKIVMIHKKISSVSKLRCKSAFNDEVKTISERLVISLSASESSFSLSTLSILISKEE